MNKRKFLKSFWVLPLLIPAVINSEEKEEQVFKAIKNDDGSTDITICGDKFINIKDIIIETTECDNTCIYTKKSKGKKLIIGNNERNITLQYTV